MNAVNELLGLETESAEGISREWPTRRSISIIRWSAREFSAPELGEQLGSDEGTTFDIGRVTVGVNRRSRLSAAQAVDATDRASEVDQLELHVPKLRSIGESGLGRRLPAGRPPGTLAYLCRGRPDLAFANAPVTIKGGIEILNDS